MTLKVDRAGRVILPKPVRERLGLQEGSDLDLLEPPEGVLLKPAVERPFQTNPRHPASRPFGRRSTPRVSCHFALFPARSSARSSRLEKEWRSSFCHPGQSVPDF
jgi:AbrB family looped-hinge helix DNA binding protein